MLGRWLRNRRRRRWLTEPVPAEYYDWLEADTPFFTRLPSRDQRRLVDLSRIFIREKAWDPRDAFELTDRIRLSIAAQACLLLLGLDDHDYYPNVKRIVIFPAIYGLPTHDGLVMRDVPAAGQANFRGPIALAWDAAAGGAMNPDDARNVVFHEFAHKLDMLDGWVDGTPPLAGRAMFDRWVAVMTRQYDALREAVSERRRTLLDGYGATNPAEFFAVATETFFEKPDQLHQRLPELYAVLADYYQQDPANVA